MVRPNEKVEDYDSDILEITELSKQNEKTSSNTTKSGTKPKVPMQSDSKKLDLPLPESIGLPMGAKKPRKLWSRKQTQVELNTDIDHEERPKKCRPKNSINVELTPPNFRKSIYKDPSRLQAAILRNAALLNEDCAARDTKVNHL